CLALRFAYRASAAVLLCCQASTCTTFNCPFSQRCSMGARGMPKPLATSVQLGCSTACWSSTWRCAHALWAPWLRTSCLTRQALMVTLRVRGGKGGKLVLLACGIVLLKNGFAHGVALVLHEPV